VRRTVDAIKKGEQLVIFGDYDVDGATSSSVLRLYLRQAGVKSTVYIPDRLKEGYGPNVPAMETLATEGNKLCFTVDCGTTAHKSVEAAKRCGMDVVVIDHHAPEASLPPAVAVINPVRLDENEPAKQYRNLAAVGMTFMFVAGLNRALREEGYFKDKPEPDIRNLLDLVALGTVADVVLLTGLNRVLVTQGLKVMALRQNIGLAALADVAQLKGPPDAWHLGYYLGPRVNAGGRVGKSDLGVNLLTTENLATAQDIAFQLNLLNRERQAIELQILDQARPEADRQAAAGAPIIMVGQEGWHPGVIGIVASRLKEEHNRPAIVLGHNPYDDTFSGSGRSVPGVDLGAAVIDARLRGLITKGGGHKMAAGVGLSRGQIEPLRTYLHERIGRELAKVDRKPTLHVDALVSAGGVNKHFIDQLGQLAPFGNGNPEPRLVLQSVRLTFAELAGANHVLCQFEGSDGSKLEAIAWRSADQPHGLALLNGRGQLFHVAGSASINEFNGRERPQFKIDDLAPA
jgi:single-stranded-DNA-specific exonuclease